jgi:hypothetical protein
MPVNDSSTGGFLTPTSTAPQTDDVLDDILQAIVVGITGLSGPLVRPRWQQNPPKEPEPGVNWIALGITNTRSDTFPTKTKYPDGSYQLKRNEYHTVLVSAYGPNSQQYLGYLRDGLFISQNLDSLRAVNANVTYVGDVKPLPEYVNTVWRRRYDLPIYISRQVIREYAILDIASAKITLLTETPLTTSTIDIHD